MMDKSQSWRQSSQKKGRRSPHLAHPCNVLQRHPQCLPSSSFLDTLDTQNPAAEAVFLIIMTFLDEYDGSMRVMRTRDIFTNINLPPPDYHGRRIPLSIIILSSMRLYIQLCNVMAGISSIWCWYVVWTSLNCRSHSFVLICVLMVRSFFLFSCCCVDACVELPFFLRLCWWLCWFVDAFLSCQRSVPFNSGSQLL